MQKYDFECWRNEFALSLTGLTYQYPYTSAVWSGAALTRPLRFDGNSVRYQSTHLRLVPSISRIDEMLGAAWKDSADGGTPRYVTEMAQSMVFGARPSLAFVVTNPTVAGYYYRGEDLSTDGYESANLAMYDDFRPYLEELALVFALQQVDDTEFRTMLQQWDKLTLPEMRGYDHIPVDDEPISAPSWASDVDGNEDVIF